MNGIFSVHYNSYYQGWQIIQDGYPWSELFQTEYEAIRFFQNERPEEADKVIMDFIDKSLMLDFITNSTFYGRKLC